MSEFRLHLEQKFSGHEIARIQGVTKSHTKSKLKFDFEQLLFVVPPHLPAVEEVLPDGIKSQVDRSQRQEIGVGNPDAHGRVFLSEQLAARNRIAVFSAEPFAEAILQGAVTHRSKGQADNRSPIAFTVQENEINGLTQGDEQGDRPNIKGAAFETA